MAHEFKDQEWNERKNGKRFLLLNFQREYCPDVLFCKKTLLSPFSSPPLKFLLFPIDLKREIST